MRWFFSLLTARTRGCPSRAAFLCLFLVAGLFSLSGAERPAKGTPAPAPPGGKLTQWGLKKVKAEAAVGRTITRMADVFSGFGNFLPVSSIGKRALRPLHLSAGFASLYFFGGFAPRLVCRL